MRDPEEVKEASKAVWGASPAGWTFAGNAEVGSREFFEAVLERRSTYEQPWLPEVAPFAAMRGRAVLEIGCGAGYDAYALMRHGADYTGIDLAPENPDRVRRHLSHFGLEPRVLEADAEALPFADESFDVVYANGVLHHTPDLARALGEAHRVLCRGGDLYFSVYNRNSIFYLVTFRLNRHVVKAILSKRLLAERRARIEYTTSDRRPLVNVYSARQLRALVREAGFQHVTTTVRKLVADDLPALPGLARLWTRIPQPSLDALGRRVGWYVWAHGVKPA